MQLNRPIRATAAFVAVLAAVWQVSLSVRLWAGRVRYPFDIEWLESSYLYQAYRVLHRLPTYGSPRDGYLPLTHPPGGMIALALVGRVVGLDFAVGRTLSYACVVSAVALVARSLVQRHDGRPRGMVLAAFAAGCVAASTPVCAGFHDLVRADGLAAFLCVALATMIDRPKARLSTIEIANAAMVVTAIVYVRIPAVFFAVWLLAYVWGRDRRSGVLLALASASLAGLVLVGLQFVSKGWFWVETIALLSGQPVRLGRFLEAGRRLVAFAPFVPALPILAAVLAAARSLSRQSVLWLGMLAASLPASLLPFAKVGGYLNDLLPVLFMIGPATAFVVADVLDALATRPRTESAVAVASCISGAAMLALRTWSPSDMTPTEEAFRRARALNDEVRALEGGVLVPRHPFLAARNGDATLQWSEMPYLDMLWSNYQDLALGAYIDRAHARWALVAGNELPTTTRELSTRYQLERAIVDPPVTMIGDVSRPRYLLRANDDESNGHVLFDFESLAGWTITGQAFLITTANPTWQRPIQGAVGGHVANSYHPVDRDPARGAIYSPEFLIDRRRISLRVGGGTGHGTRVELRSDGRVQRVATGIFEGQETLTRVVWDVADLRGQRATLALIDEDDGPWGHLVCDRVVAY